MGILLRVLSKIPFSRVPLAFGFIGVGPRATLYIRYHLL